MTTMHSSNGRRFSFYSQEVPALRPDGGHCAVQKCSGAAGRAEASSHFHQKNGHGCRIEGEINHQKKEHFCRWQQRCPVK